MDNLDVAIHKIAMEQKSVYAQKCYMESKDSNGASKWSWDMIRIPFGR